MTSRRVDVGSVAGVLGGIGLVAVGQTLEGGAIGSLFQGAAAAIVFGGTLGAVLTSFSLDDVLLAVRSVRDVFHEARPVPENTIERVTRYAHVARRRGLIALEDELVTETDPMLRSGLALAIDGTSPEMVREILEIESRTRGDRDETPARVFESAGGYAPTVGILGAVLGLIHVMEHLTDPSRIGSGVAVAFVATVYGVGSANLLFLPLAAKLRGRADANARLRELAIDGVLAIQDGLNPHVIEQKLRGRLAPAPDRAAARPARRPAFASPGPLADRIRPSESV